MQEYDTTSSGNFRLVKRIDTLDQFWHEAQNNKVLFFNHRVFSSAFFIGWPIKTVKLYTSLGLLWTVERITKPTMPPKKFSPLQSLLSALTAMFAVGGAFTILYIIHLILT